MKSLPGAVQGVCLLLGLVACAPPPAPDREGLATRIVSLAPHLTEMAYAVGAGDRLVGAVEFSDYPPAARQLPRVGDAFRIDYEVLAGLSPDLILAWRTGNPTPLIQQLRGLGYRVAEFDAVSLENLPGQLRRLGELAGTRAEANRAADAVRAELQAIQEGHRDVEALKVFYQVSREPLFTVSDRHIIGQIIRLCGGENVFGNLDGLTAVVDIEAVLAAAPEVILIGGPPDHMAVMREDWQSWGALPAASRGEIHTIDPDLVSRPGPRIVLGAIQVCEILDAARVAAGLSPASSAT